MAWTVKDRRDAHFCHHGAKTMLQYLDAMMGTIDGVRENEDIEYLHRMRVASRRLRSLLPLVSECLPTKQAVRWRRRLRRVTRALGDARDADVQAVCLQDALEDCRDDSHRPGLERLLLRFRQRRGALQEPLTDTLERLASGRRMRRMEMALRYLLATSQLYADVESARHTYARCRSAIMRLPGGGSGSGSDHSRAAMRHRTAFHPDCRQAAALHHAGLCAPLPGYASATPSALPGGSRTCSVTFTTVTCGWTCFPDFSTRKRRAHSPTLAPASLSSPW